MTEPQTDGGHVMRLIAQLPADSQRRVWVMVSVLRDLLKASANGEAELAFTLVMAELADEGFTLETGGVKRE